jgi:hypothetical protein
MREYSVRHHGPHHFANFGQEDVISMLGGAYLASNLWGSSKLFCSKLLGLPACVSAPPYALAQVVCVVYATYSMLDMHTPVSLCLRQWFSIGAVA